MNKYGKAAISATKNYSENTVDILKAWELAVMEQFPTQEASRKKGCPKSVFLGLCEDGFVKGIPKGNYIKRKIKLNKGYAIKAVNILFHNKVNEISPRKLWELVMEGEQKTPNAQMDVVLSLWNNNLINRK